MPRNSINCYIIEGVLIDSGIRSSYTTVKKLYGKSLLINIYLRMHMQTIRAVAIRYALNSDSLLCHPDEIFRTETGMVTTDYPNSQHWVAKLQQKYWAGQGHKVDRTVVENDKIGNFQVIETPDIQQVIFLYFESRMVY
jgi:hypothetical protein